MRSLRGDPGLVFATLSLALVILCVPASRSRLPGAAIPAIDLHNLWVFHNCELRNMPYGGPSSGVDCGDLYGRPMYYPPLLYWTFAWLRLVSFETAVLIWRSVIVGGVLACLVAWMRRVETTWRPSTLLFLFLLLPQFPTVFAAERANSDVLILILWTLSAVAVGRSRLFFAGVVASLAVMAKVYPVFAAIVFCCLLVKQPPRLGRFVAGLGFGAIASVASFPMATLAYVEVLNEFASQNPRAVEFSHGLPSHLGSAAGWLVAGVLLLIWAGAGLGAVEQRAQMTVLAGAIAISTIFSNTSFDYNLITVYPLMVLLFIKVRTRPDVWSTASLWVLIISVLGSRAYFLGYGREKVLLEVLGLALAAMSVIRERSASPSSQVG